MHLSARSAGKSLPNRSCNGCTSLLIENKRASCEAASEFAKIPRDRDEGSSRMSRIARNPNALVPATFDSLGSSRVSSVRLMSAVETVSRETFPSERMENRDRIKIEIGALGIARSRMLQPHNTRGTSEWKLMRLFGIVG